MFNKKTLVCLIALVSVSASAGDLRAKLTARSDEAALVVQELVQTPDSEVPVSLLKSATCIMVIPSEKKIGYGVGIKYGRGLVSCRNKEGWSAPSYMMIAGPSVGWQVGIKNSDIVLVFTRSNASRVVSQPNLTLSAAADLSVGPLGRDLQAGTDFRLSAIFSYSRSTGLFAGATVEGALVQPDESANTEIYGRAATTQTILQTVGTAAPKEVLGLVTSLDKFVP